jgi:hypothetical protein
MLKKKAMCSNPLMIWLWNMRVLNQYFKEIPRRL